MKSFRTLELAVEFYELVEMQTIPGHLRDQILRASSSISLNLAEGNAKFSKKDKSRIFQIALGSLREVQVALRLAKVNDEKIHDLADAIGGSLYKLIKAHQNSAVN